MSDKSIPYNTWKTRGVDKGQDEDRLNDEDASYNDETGENE